MTRDDLLARLPEAVVKTGDVTANETWSGTIHVMGDVLVQTDATLTIEAGTLVLVAARSDDQQAGGMGDLDLFNPKDPPYDGQNRTSFRVSGTLIINGSQEEPVILTSDATNPQNDDWGDVLLKPEPGCKVEITRAIIEFTGSVGIDSSEVMVRQSILRNMMGCVVIGGMGPETDPDTALDLTPTLTQNYIYNGGRHMVTVRSGAPTISHNVIMARPDMDTTGWEQGPLGLDFPSCPVIHHNYLDGSQPRPYDGEIFGEYLEFTQPEGFVMAGICPFTFEYNTVTGSPLAIIGHAGNWSLQHNNIIPIPATGAAAQSPYGHGWNSTLTGIHAYDHRPEPSDQWQFVFLEEMGGVPLEEEFSAPNNFWGTADPHGIEELLKPGNGCLRIEYQPFEAEFIVEALPDWHEFEW
ncbi:hypothetical protein ACFLXE_04350 [Chloroflexota bacterium]